MKAKHKWLMIVADIIHWELTCAPGELLSEEADRWVAKHPILARVGIVLVGTVLTAHLANLVPHPEKYDIVAADFWLRFKN